MTLHEAIQQLLINSKSELTTTELAKLINDQELYIRKDKKQVTASQVMSRIGNYPKLFVKNGSKISLKGFNELDLIEEEIKIDLKNLVSYFYSRGLANTYVLLPLVLRTIIELDSSHGDINNLDRFFENILREIDLGRSIESRSSDIFQHLYDVTLKIQKHPNRNRVLQKVIYWLNDSNRGSGLMLLPEYLCSIIGSLEIYGENTFLHTTANMLNTFKLSIAENYPEYNFDHNYSDEWAVNEVLKLNDLIMRASDVHFTQRTNSPLKRIGVITPPWGVKVRNQWSSNFSFIMEQIESYGKPLLDKALLVVPEGALFSGGKDHKARTILTESQYVKSIVTIPFNSNYTSIKSAVLILFDFEKPNENVLFADFNQLEKFDIEHDWQRVASLMNSNDSVEEISTIVNTDLIVENACMWLPNRYLLESISFEKKEGHETVSLKTVLSNWYRGKNVPRKKLYEGGELKYIRTSDLPNEDVYLNISEKTLGVDSDEFEENVYPIENSIGVTLIGNEIKSTVIPSKGLFLFNPHIAVLKVDSSKVLPEFLARELRKDYVKNQLDQYRKGTTVPTISLKDFLDEILIQVPSVDLQKDILLEKVREVVTQEEIENRENLSKAILHNYLGIIKHTMKQPLATLSEDINNLNLFLKRKSEEKILDLNDFIIDLLPGEKEEENEQSRVTNTLNRLSRAISDAHWRFEQSEKLLRIETSDVSLKKEAILGVLKEQAKNYPDIKISVKGKNAVTLLDKNLWNILIDNFIDNARKHGFINQSNPKILFEVKTEKKSDGTEEIVIYYSNNGKPLPSNFNIDKFISNGMTSNKEAGDGFGGYLINSIIKKHEGRIDIIPNNKMELNEYNVCFKIYLKAI